jgi:riboflavin synthase
MFTGIVEKIAAVIAIADGPRFRRLTLASEWPDVRLGQSIAVNGCCLTIAELSDGELGFDVISETLEKTNLGRLKPGDHVNVERALRMGDRFDGHFVQGHIDGTAKLAHVEIEDDQWRLTLEAPKNLTRYLIPKGSVALDGVSLTIASLNGPEFQVALIPTTISLTTLASMQPGWPVNLEADMTVKTIVSTLEHFKLMPRK